MLTDRLWWIGRSTFDVHFFFSEPSTVPRRKNKLALMRPCPLLFGSTPGGFYTRMLRYPPLMPFLENTICHN